MQYNYTFPQMNFFSQKTSQKTHTTFYCICINRQASAGGLLQAYSYIRWLLCAIVRSTVWDILQLGSVLSFI